MTSCPSFLAVREDSKSFTKPEREVRVLIRRMISQLLSSQAAANFCASGSDFSPVGSLPTSPRPAAASSPISCIRSMLKRLLLEYLMSLVRCNA